MQVPKEMVITGTFKNNSGERKRRNIRKQMRLHTRLSGKLTIKKEYAGNGG